MKLGPFLILLTLLYTFGLFLLSKPDSYFSQPNILQFSGQLTSLLGTTLLAWSYFLSTRLKILEGLFSGLDKVYKYHHLVSGSAFVLLLNHPLLLAANSLPNPNFLAIYFLPGTNLAYTFGVLALYALIALVISTLYLKLPYHIWKSLHEYSGLVMLAGGLHAFLITSDMSRYFPLRLWMLALITLSLLAFVYIRFLYHKFGPIFKYQVSSVKRTGDFIDITLVPTSKPITYSPGQFVFVKFPKFSRADSQPHPFSIASNPLQSEFRLSVKITGDYTLELINLTPGQSALVYGPYGQFLDHLPITDHAVFIAGGIGITPFLSALTHSQALPPQSTLIHSVTDSAQSPYHKDLSTLSLQHRFAYYLHDSLTQGRLTAKRILELIPPSPPHTKTRFFLCGPQAMMHSLASQLTINGIKPSLVVFEDFSFV